MVGFLLADIDTSPKYFHCLFWLSFIISVICHFSRAGNNGKYLRLCSEILGMIRADDFGLATRDGEACW